MDQAISRRQLRSWPLQPGFEAPGISAIHDSQIRTDHERSLLRLTVTLGPSSIRPQRTGCVRTSSVANRFGICKNNARPVRNPKNVTATCSLNRTRVMNGLIVLQRVIQN